MFVEYSRVLRAGAKWIFTLAYLCWIYEDSKRHNARFVPWIAGVLAVQISSQIPSFVYWMVILPSKGISLEPPFIFNTSNFVEPLWVLDIVFLWENIVLDAISTTISALVLLWIYRDCQKSGIRGSPWIFGMILVLNMPFPLSLVIPIGGWTGQIIIMIGYMFRKLGYI